MLAGPNLPADISIPWHRANWHRCRETESERGKDRMKENHSRTEGGGNEGEKRKSAGGGITIYGSEKTEGRKRRTIMVGLRNK